MPVVKDSLFVEAVIINIIFENVNNCLFSFYYNNSNSQNQEIPYYLV